MYFSDSKSHCHDGHCIVSDHQVRWRAQTAFAYPRAVALARGRNDLSKQGRTYRITSPQEPSELRHPQPESNPPKTL